MKQLCLGFITKSNGEFKQYVDHRIKYRWIKWKFILGQLCDKECQQDQKESATRLLPDQLYGTKHKATTKMHTHKMSFADMYMFKMDMRQKS